MASTKSSSVDEINTVTDADREAFRSMFIMFDSDGNDEVSLEELKSGLSASTGQVISDENAKALISKAGGTGDKLNEEQFVRLMENLKKSSPTLKETNDAFAVFDKNGTKRVRCKDFKKSMMSMGADPMSESEVDKFVSVANPERPDDNSIAYDSFVQMISSQTPDCPWIVR